MGYSNALYCKRRSTVEKAQIEEKEILRLTDAWKREGEKV